MPRNGVFTVGDMREGEVLEIVCDRCDRRGVYRKATLLERFGDMGIPEVIGKIAACPRRGQYHDGCKAKLGRPIAAAGRGR
jgi:hypothetical protein